jgi:hypothetical protein
VGADRVGERLAAAVAASSERPSLTYLYDGDLDWTGHRYGVASDPWQQQLAMVDAEAEQLRESLPSDVRLLVIADHGMVDSPKASRVDVDAELELRDGLFLMGGEARFRHLYCRSGAIDDVAATWRSVLGDRADVLTREEAIGRGWFGAVEPLVRPRLGDVVVACRGYHAVVSTADFGYESTLIGLHGSLTADEMLIPLLVDGTVLDQRVAQPKGSGSGARLTAWALAAVRRRRWCWRHSTSYATSAGSCSGSSTSPTTITSPSTTITPFSVRALWVARLPHQHRASTCRAWTRSATSTSRPLPSKSRLRKSVRMPNANTSSWSSSTTLASWSIWERE